MSEEREYDDMQRDTRDRERMEMSGSDRERSDDQLNPDFRPDRMDLHANDDMRSADDAESTDPKTRRLSDVDPMKHGHVREDDSTERSNAVRADETSGTRRAVTASEAPGTRATQMELWPDMGDLRHRFDAIQSEFIDDPRSAVHKAEELINDVVERVTRSMRERVDSMHSDAGQNADTEQLRQTMRGYRDLVVWMETRRAA